MASHVFTGPAANHRDLLDKLRGHLTDGVALGAQVWVVEKYSINQGSASNIDELYLRGPGLSGTDNIHVNIQAYQDSGTDIFNWKLSGAVAFNTLVSFGLQPGLSNFAHMALWDSSIPYWVIANGRRFIVVAKVSTTYQTFYGGYILPYSTASEMPYPIAIAGSSGGAAYAGWDTIRWSAGVYHLGSFWDPVVGSAYIRMWSGFWLEIANMEFRADTQRYELTSSCVWPWERDYGIAWNKDGTYGLLPAVIHSNHDGGNVLGEYEGVFFVSGFSNASEDIITVGGDQYLVVQSAYRTGRRDYAAIKLG